MRYREHKDAVLTIAATNTKVVYGRVSGVCRVAVSTNTHTHVDYIMLTLDIVNMCICSLTYKYIIYMRVMEVSINRHICAERLRVGKEWSAWDEWVEQVCKEAAPKTTANAFFDLLCC